MILFRCTVPGCDAGFLNSADMEKHIKEDLHCKQCGESDRLSHNPIDYEPCDLCDWADDDDFGEDCDD